MCRSVTDGSAPLFTSLLNYRHSAVKRESEWTEESGVRRLLGQERTNYPVTVSVDDMGDEFILSAQTNPSIDAGRLTDYLRVAIQSVVEALEEAPQQKLMSLSILPETERNRILEVFNASSTENVCASLAH
jgi:hypothetical protein